MKSSKLICLVNSFISTSGGDVRFIEIMKRFKNLDVTVITSKLGRQLCKAMGLYVNFKITTHESKVSNLILLYIKRITSVLKLELDLKEDDIVYSTSDFFPDVLPAFIWKLRKKNIKWVALLHLVAPNPFCGFDQKHLNKLPTLRGFLYKIGQLISIILIKKANIVLAPNGEIKNYLMRRGVAVDKIRVVNNGIDFKMIQGVKASERNKYDGIFVGRFHSQKGIFDLIKIWELIKSRKKNCRLLLIGCENQCVEDRVKKEIIARNLEENIDLVGIKGGIEKFSLIKSGKVFLFPSFHESWGIVATEAMACGLPVVAYDLPIYTDIYENNILKVSIGNVNQFAKTVIKLLDNEKLRNDLGLKGQRFMQKYDWDKIAEREFKILRSIA